MNAKDAFECLLMYSTAQRKEKSIKKASSYEAMSHVCTTQVDAYNKQSWTHPPHLGATLLLLDVVQGPEGVAAQSSRHVDHCLHVESLRRAAAESVAHIMYIYVSWLTDQGNICISKITLLCMLRTETL